LRPISSFLLPPRISYFLLPLRPLHAIDVDAIAQHLAAHRDRGGALVPARDAEPLTPRGRTEATIEVACDIKDMLQGAVRNLPSQRFIGSLVRWFW
jgi:hypothetical protein